MELDQWELEKYYSKHPKVRLGGWQNMSPGRGLLDVLLYKPIQHVSKIQIPTLIVALKDDSLCSVEVRFISLEPRTILHYRLDSFEHRLLLSVLQWS